MKQNAMMSRGASAALAALTGIWGVLASFGAQAAGNAIFTGGTKVLTSVQTGGEGWMDLIFILSIMAMAGAWAILRKPILGWLGVVLVAAFLFYHADDLLSLVKGA